MPALDEPIATKLLRIPRDPAVPAPVACGGGAPHRAHAAFDESFACDPETALHVASLVAVPLVLDRARHLRPSDRLPAVVSVGALAFGRCRDAERVPAHLAQAAYRAVTEAARRLAGETAPANPWEPWETEYLSRACASLAGQLRRACTSRQDDRMPPIDGRALGAGPPRPSTCTASLRARRQPGVLELAMLS